jgi:hypothetical protein
VKAVRGRWAALWRPARVAARDSDHALRERRLESIRDAVEEFAYGLAQLIAGHEVSAAIADSALAHQVRGALEPFLSRGDVMRPDFGAFGDLRVEGDLLQRATPVLATLDFDDRCVRQTSVGRLLPARRRRLRLVMHVAVEPLSVIDCSFSEVVPRGA